MKNNILINIYSYLIKIHLQTQNNYFINYNKITRFLQYLELEKAF